MTLSPTVSQARFDAAHRAWSARAKLEEELIRAAVRALAAHALSVAPDATHMLLESSDQGDHMCAPSWLQKDGENVAEEAWDAHYTEHVDSLSDAAMWLPWGVRTWEQYIDHDHPYTRPKSGSLALDLRRIAADAEAEPGPCPSGPDGEHDWQLTEEGYVRTWSTAVNHEKKVVRAAYSGTEDWSEDGDGPTYLECLNCTARIDVPEDYTIDWV